MLFDSHCHLNNKDLYAELDTIINNALENNITKMLVVGYDYESSRLALEIAKQYDFIYAAVGVHPNDIMHTSEEEFKLIEEMAKEEKVVAIGEIGLDYYWDEVDRETQKKIFKYYLEFANKVNKPITIHCRDAYQDTYDILKENKHLLNKGGIMHCYGGSVEMVDQFLDLGLYISLAGPVTFKNAKTPKEVAKIVPIDKLLVETDCPYLTPHPFRGKRNEPKMVELVAKEIANLREMDFEELAQKTMENTCRLLGI